jgi:ATP-dependent Clp protease ATP-binding subunit ClpC
MQELNDIFKRANEESLDRELDAINIDMLLLAMCSIDCKANNLLSKIVSVELIKANIVEHYSNSNSSETLPVDKLPFSNDLQNAQRVAMLEKNILKSLELGTEHFLLAILLEKTGFSINVLNKLGVTYDIIQKDLKTGSNMVNSKTNKKKEESILEKFGINLTALAKKGKLKPVIGRSREIQRLAEILSRKEKNNPILIGEPGVGKTSIVEGLVLEVVNKNISPFLHDKIIYTLDVNLMVAGTKYRGQFEERMKVVIEEVLKNPNIVLFIDEIHTVMGAGDSEGGLDMANVLKPSLSKGQFQCIGSTTLKEYKRIEKDGAFDRRFQKIVVEEASKSDTFKILQELQKYYGDFHKIKYSEESLEACIELADKYLPNKVFPDKSTDLMDETGAVVKLKNMKIPAPILELDIKIKEIQNKLDLAVKEQNFDEASALKNEKISSETERNQLYIDYEKENIPIVTLEDVQDTVSIITGIPVKEISKTEKEKLYNLSSELKSVVIGQDSAIDSICETLKRNAVGIRDPKQPITKLMFLGSSGCGKTYLVKQLAKKLFGSDTAMIRLDMSEYMESHSVAKIIGSPPGYIGYGEGGQLTEKVRHKPYSILLFDEIEKAHPDVLNIFLQILDEGSIKDSAGMKTDFKNTIIIFTSNAGTSFTKNVMGFGKESTQHTEKINKAFEGLFAKEFINRIDEVIIFNQLTHADVLKILDIYLEDLKDKLKENSLSINIDDGTKEYLVEEGYSKDYGVRALDRTIKKILGNRIADSLLTGIIKKGDSIQINYDGILKIANVEK